MKGLAITSMILGIVAICISVFSCGLMAPFAIPIALVGVILGGVSLSQYKKAEKKDGKGMATAGLVLSVIVLGISLLMVFMCSGCAALGIAGA